MRRCICLYKDVNVTNISLMSNNVLVANKCSNDSVMNYLNSSHIDEVSVILKPNVVTEVVDGSYLIGDFLGDTGTRNLCVVSENTINSLTDVGHKYGIKSMKVYNYIDVVCSKFKKDEKIIIVSPWNNSLVALIYSEFGIARDFKLSSESRLASLIGRFRSKYNCRVVEDISAYDYVGLKDVVTNLDEVDKEKRCLLAHIPYVFYNKGIDLLKPKPVFSAVVNPMEKMYIEDYSVDDDVDDDDLPPEPSVKKSGFFSGLFKKNKPTVTKSVATGPSEDLRRDYNEYLNTNLSNVSYAGYGQNALALKESSTSDILLYGVLIVVVTCIILSFCFNGLYRMRISNMVENVETIEKFANEKESSVNMASSDSQVGSVLTKVISSDLPENCVITSARYDTDGYSVQVASSNDAIESGDIKSSLPSDLKIADIDKNPANINSKGVKYTSLFAVTIIPS